MKKVFALVAGLLGSLVVWLAIVTGGGNANAADVAPDDTAEFAPWCDRQVDETVYGCPIVVKR